MPRAPKGQAAVVKLEHRQAEELFREGWRLLDAGKDRRGYLALLESARRGHVEAQQGLGYLFDVGRGVRRSVKDALYWYRRAARAGDGAAAGNIGILYRDRRSRALAMRWFRKAVELGVSDVLLEIARLEASSARGRRAAILTLRRLLACRDVLDSTREEAEELLLDLTRLAIAGPGLR